MFIYKQETVLENNILKILLDFEIKIDNPISARKYDLVITDKKKRTHQGVDFLVPGDHSHEIKTKKYLFYAREKSEEYEDDNNTNHSRSTRNKPQEPKENGTVIISRKN